MKTVTVSKTVEVDVDVEVEMSEFDTEDLLEELALRGNDWVDTGDLMMEMFYAFKLGKNDHALELAKKIAQEHTGMIL